MTSNEFTEREIELMSLAWLCIEGEHKVDYKKLAGLSGMTNPGSASNAWMKIKKRIAARADACPGGNGETPPPTPPKKRGRRKAAAVGEDSPTKKQKGPGRKGKISKKEESAESGQEPANEGDE